MNATHSAKRRKKDRGQAPACREIREYTVFFLRKKFRQRRKGIFGVTHTYVRTNVTVSPGRHRRKHARISRLAVLGIQGMLVRTYREKCSPTLRIFGMFFLKKSSTVHYDCKKDGPVNQSPQAVRKRTFAKRQIDRYDSRNKRLKEKGFQREEGDRNQNPPKYANILREQDIRRWHRRWLH